jgi:hypothetical protein
MAPVDEPKKARGRPKRMEVGGRGAHLRKPRAPEAPTGRPRGRPPGPGGPREPYVPTGNPRGRPKGSHKVEKRGAHFRKTPYVPKGPYVPTGKPKGRPKKVVEGGE